MGSQMENNQETSHIGHGAMPESSSSELHPTLTSTAVPQPGNEEGPGHLGDQLRSKWSPLLNFLQTNSDLITSQFKDYSTHVFTGLPEYLDVLVALFFSTSAESLRPSSMHSSNSKESFLPFSQLSLTQKKKANDEAIANIFKEYTDILTVCMIFTKFYTPTNGNAHGDICVADRMRTLIEGLAKDVKECSNVIDGYYRKGSIYKVARASEYGLQISQFAMAFERQRILIQTTLALYLSLPLGAVHDTAINKQIAFALKFFPELHPHPLREDSPQRALDGLPYIISERIGPDAEQTSPEIDQKLPHASVRAQPLYKFNPSALPSTLPPTARSRTSSFSSYQTARDTISLAASSSHVGFDPWRSFDGVSSSYSVASSRTAETNYGLFYTRMALSQTSLDSTMTKTLSPELRRSRSWTQEIGRPFELNSNTT